MDTLHFTQEQVNKILEQFTKREGGIQDLLTMSLEAIMKAERSLHNEVHSDVSNGFRSRKAFGQGKLLELRVPRTRFGQFYPVLLGLLRDQEEECRKLAFSLYGAGLTTEQVGDLFGEIYGRSYSTSQVSRLFDGARAEVQQWLQRPLECYYPIVMIDACFIPTRRVDSVSKEAYYTIIGVKPDRTREVLAVVNFPTEHRLGWQEVFQAIKDRGVQEIGLLVCDALPRIEEAVAVHYSHACIQLCTVHLERHVQKYVKPKDKAEVASELKQIFKAGDSRHTPEKAKQLWKVFCDKWSAYYPSIGRKFLSDRTEMYFTYLNYDYRIQNMIYTTNWVERLNRDYKRTTRMRGALPNQEATILLLGYVAMTRKAYWRKIPKLDYENRYFRWEN